MNMQSLLREINQPVVAHLATMATGKLQLYAGANPISWRELITSFVEDNTSVRCIAPIPEVEGYKMLMTCVNDLGTTYYVVKTLEK